jgi:3-hydroxyisobutyrate dehydrogenase-like beta-hydroxyacid dehydrogenase
MAKDRIGVVGPGRMGLAMVKHLVRNDYPVTVTDISPDAIKAAEALGADSVGNPAELGKIANFIIIAVGFDNEAIAVMTGEDGLLDTMAPGSIIAISSTVHPETVHELAAAAKAKGIDIYDAPISRGRRAADEGTLLAVVGGADAVVERAAPVYSAFCSDIHHIGPLGHGQIAKSINNLVHWVNGLMLIEAGKLCEANDVDLQKLRDAMLISTGTSAALEGWQTMSFTWALKDMQIIQGLMDKANMGSPLIGAVRELVKEGRKLKAENAVPDWTGLGTDLS